MSAVVSAAQTARSVGVPVILDPAPAQLDIADLYSLVDIITPNETEAGQMVGFPVMSQIQLLRQQMFYGTGV